MEGLKVIPVAGLLKRRRPVTGARSLSSPAVSATPAPPPATGGAKTLNSNSLPNSRILRSLGEPCLIVGTLSLPAFSDDPSSSSSSCHHNCFCFSDDSASVCCDVVDFDVRMLGKKIFVLSWNFVPLRGDGGFIEIIKWSYASDYTDSSDDSGVVSAVPLVTGSVKHESEVQKARHCVYGLLESVSPISVVPCTIGTDQNGSSGSTKGCCGFIVQILACRCKVCSPGDISAISHDCVLGVGKHSFNRVTYVYFVGVASSWHPAILRLAGNAILMSRLKKKLVYMTKEDKQIVFITTEETCLLFPRLHCTSLPPERFRSNVGIYTGVVRGIYVQGMVVELDEDVWLLLTDQLLVPPHSIRVGSVITVRNVHLVNPKFLWGKVLVLGACHRTSISVASFSPLETGCLQVLKSRSLLGKYIGSLSFPARLWVLLIVQCFRTKFVGDFSEKEILGSNHKEGIAQKYASSILQSGVVQAPESGVFIQFCKHDLCGCSRELSCSTLNLVPPIIVFVKSCEVMWLKSLLHTLDSNSLVSHLFGEHESCGPKIRKIIPSKGTGVSLLGNLKVSPSSGRLQLADATCCIDVVVPDLPSSFSVNDIFEVVDYSVVIEGDSRRISYFKMVDKHAFSCRNIFQRKSSEADNGLDIFIFFLWRNATCRFSPVKSHNSKGPSVQLDSGTYHLFLLTHKLPRRPKAVVLPWDVYLVMNEGVALSTQVPVEGRKRCCIEDGLPNKRRNTDFAPSLVKETGPFNNYQELEIASSENLHESFMRLSQYRINQKLTSTVPAEIPCSVTVRHVQGPCSLCSAILYSTKTNTEASGTKVLLEFSAETILKYKLLKIGAYYVIKHGGRDPFCGFQGINCEHKVVIKSDAHIWSVSFSTEENVSDLSQSHDLSSSYPLAADDLHEDKKLSFHGSTCSSHDHFADVNLWVSSELVQLFNSKLKVLNGICSFYEPVGSKSNTLGFQQCPLSFSSGGLLPEGNLINICGTVISLHWAVTGIADENQRHNQLRSYQEGREIICLHISNGMHIVKVYGVLCKADYPLGLGLGSNATFHRILEVSGKNHFMLTPVSFITVNCVNEFEEGHAHQFVNSSSVLHPCGSVPRTPLQSIYDRIQQPENSMGRFICKVVAVHTLVLNGRNMHQLPRDDHRMLMNVAVPIAGFIIDDGLQPSCCWASGERAAKLMRLNEEVRYISHKHRHELERLGRDESYSNTRSRLIKILSKHKTITVKNYGSLFDSLGQDLQLHGGSDCVISSSDEEVLRFIILNASSGSLWCVRGPMVDSSIVKEIERHLKEDQAVLHSLPNVWAAEVDTLNLLSEARDIIQNL